MFVRLAYALLLLTAAAAALAGPAGAEKPVRGPAASPPSLDFPAGIVCDFAVHAEALVNRQTETIFASGKVLYTGYFETLVAANGKELRLNTSGPTRLTPEGDLLRVTSGGPLLIFFFPGDAGPGDTTKGRTYLVHGHTTFLVDPATFVFLEFESKGTLTDVCALLAP
jgi:hypothetical protein